MEFNVMMKTVSKLIARLSSLRCRKMGWMASSEWRWHLCFTGHQLLLMNPTRMPSRIFGAIQEKAELHREDDPHQGFFLTHLTLGGIARRRCNVLSKHNRCRESLTLSVPS